MKSLARKLTSTFLGSVPVSRGRALSISERLTAVTSLTSSLEYITHQRQIHKGGLNDWSIARGMHASSTRPTRRILDAVGNPRTTGALHAIGQFQQGRAAIRRVDELTALAQEGGVLDRMRHRMRPPAKSSLAVDEDAVEFRSVRFSYGGKDDETAAEALSDASFTVAARGMTAVVGPSGAGKTTLFQLIERFHELDSGSILIGGNDVATMPLATLRGLVGYVQQDTAAMRGTVRENLVYAQPEADEAEIGEVIELAGLTKVIEGLPHGLDTELGDQGSGLSGGQRQRLCSARALLQRPAVLLLDEATSALDSDSEREFRETLRKVSGRCAVIAIAHRISTVVDADKIVVMSDGRVRACGRHDDLMKRDPLYYRLANSQLHAAASAQPGSVPAGVAL